LEGACSRKGQKKKKPNDNDTYRDISGCKDAPDSLALPHPSGARLFEAYRTVLFSGQFT
jgi:hypothetical protein